MDVDDLLRGRMLAPSRFVGASNCPPLFRSSNAANSVVLVSGGSHKSGCAPVAGNLPGGATQADVMLADYSPLPAAVRAPNKAPRLVNTG